MRIFCHKFPILLERICPTSSVNFFSGKFFLAEFLVWGAVFCQFSRNLPLPVNAKSFLRCSLMMLHQKIAKRETLVKIPNHAIKIWYSEAVCFIPVCRWDSQPYDQNLVFHSQLCKRTPAIAAGSKENTHPHIQFCLINKTQAGSLVRLASETLSMKNYYW